MNHRHRSTPGAVVPEFIPGTDLGDPNKRKAFSTNMKVGKFDFLLVGTHLKSGRSAPYQAIRAVLVI